ncbi:hypothetical protein OV207_06705 [Corallococcus sp. BB11-1]|uniref:hypothetical protein n=1 Tax=Corallococcus sp. BB11-1 TaxID=2996783 RepID=UPI00226E6966|nr:hypothetical protein [Corallococcus sp. BB11-1]MCY1031141.1 hypothetical protein [Corallococcus sp. BB11-1]
MSDASRPRPRTSSSAVEGGEGAPSDLAAWEPEPSAQGGTPTPPLGSPLPMLLLAQQARRASGAERLRLAAQLNELLADLAAEGGGRVEADAFHRLLEGGTLEGLVDADGRTCRAAAVESLLALGFPYALEVRPEDLEHLRSTPVLGTQLSPPRGGPFPALAVGLGALAAQVLLHATGLVPPGGLLILQGLLTLVCLTLLTVASVGSALYRGALALLTVVSGLGLGMLLVPDVPAGWAAGLGGLVAAFLAALRKS